MGTQGSLLGSRLARGNVSIDGDFMEEIDPQSGLLNLADVMLVFAVALMVALISFYNVDITNTETGPKTAASNVELLEGELEEAGSGSDLDSEGNYTELGTVYRDEASGQLYVLSPPPPDSAEVPASEAGGSAFASASAQAPAATLDD